MDVAATIVGGCVILALLPDGFTSYSEVLFGLREYIRKTFQSLVRLTLQGPFFQLFAWCLRRYSKGYLSSKCRPPHSLRALAVGDVEAVLQWAPTMQQNPFHEEHYVCAWCPVGEGSSTTAEIDDQYWSEQVILEREEASHGLSRWVAILEGLPIGTRVRARVCAANRWGRSAWCPDELVLDLAPASPQTNSAQPRGNSTRTLGRATVVTPGSRLCLRCRVQQPALCTVAYADLVSKPLFGSSCPHGPFCPRCQSRVEAQVLPSCVCRALIGAWRHDS